MKIITLVNDGDGYAQIHHVQAIRDIIVEAKANLHDAFVMLPPHHRLEIIELAVNRVCAYCLSEKRDDTCWACGASKDLELPMDYLGKVKVESHEEVKA